MITRETYGGNPGGRRLEDHYERGRLEPSLSGVLRAWTATLDAIEDLISVHDWEFRIVRANRALSRRLGCEPATLIGQTCYRIFHGADEPPPDCPHVRARLTGATTAQELVDSPWGVPLHITCSLYYDEAGRPAGTVHVARDVSEEKRREEERQALIARLQEALEHAKILDGLLPICSSCKCIRDEEGYWNQLEAYIQARSDAEFTHGICPKCAQELYPRWCGSKKPAPG